MRLDEQEAARREQERERAKQALLAREEALVRLVAANLATTLEQQVAAWHLARVIRDYSETVDYLQNHPTGLHIGRPSGRHCRRRRPPAGYRRSPQSSPCLPSG
jgi:hypothetical protein